MKTVSLRLGKVWLWFFTLTFLALAFGTWRQLHNGWVWYHFLRTNSPTSTINVANNYLLPDGLAPILQSVATTPEQGAWLHDIQGIKQYGLAQRSHGDFVIEQMVVRSSLLATGSIQDRLVQENFHTLRLGWLIYAQTTPINKLEIIKNIYRNIGKNYLSKNPIALLEIPARASTGTAPAVILAEPHQAGIKTYIGLNKEHISQKDQHKLHELQNPAANSESIALLREEQIKHLPGIILTTFQHQLQQHLGFIHTQPALFHDLATPTVFAFAGDEKKIAWAGPQSNAPVVIKYLNQEEAHNHPVTTFFTLPNGQRGQEVVPDHSRTYFQLPSTGCGPIQINDTNIHLCQRSNSFAIGTDQSLLTATENLLANSDHDWYLTLQKNLLDSIPQLTDWTRLTAYQKGDDVAVFLEK